jgi:hypothetical protein
MSKSRINISMDPGIRALADEVMAARRFGDFSGFIEQLIREEFERRTGPMQISVLPTQVEDAVRAYSVGRSPQSKSPISGGGGKAPAVPAGSAAAPSSAPRRRGSSRT